MPRIDLIPEVYYEALHPYHYLFDNMPLRNIMARITMINDTVDTDHQLLGNAIGSTSSLEARLAASLEDDGSLKTAAIDEALHSIEEHTDTADQSAFLEEDDEFVRMTERERNKLDLMQDEANHLDLNFEAVSPSLTPVNFESGTVTLANSLSTTWRYEGGKIYLDLAFPLEAAHRHYYDVVPTNPDEDLQTYYTPVEYVEGSLKVFVNGVRLSENNYIYHPGATPTSDWVLNLITPTSTKIFVLDQAITADDIITIDFDITLT